MDQNKKQQKLNSLNSILEVEKYTYPGNRVARFDPSEKTVHFGTIVGVYENNSIDYKLIHCSYNVRWDSTVPSTQAGCNAECELASMNQIHYYSYDYEHFTDQFLVSGGKVKPKLNCVGKISKVSLRHKPVCKNYPVEKGGAILTPNDGDCHPAAGHVPGQLE